MKKEKNNVLVLLVLVSIFVINGCNSGESILIVETVNNDSDDISEIEVIKKAIKIGGEIAVNVAVFASN